MADTRMLSFEQAVSATVVADVQISPDGRQIAYVTTSASKEAELPSMAIWLADTDSGTSRRLTTSDAADNTPRWSPDGTRIAFISDRKERGKAQVYVLALAGGEAVRLTDAKGPVTAIQWSPEGRRLAFTAMSEEDEDEKKRKEERNDHKIIDDKPARAGLFVIDVPDDAAMLSTDALPEPKRVSPEDLHVGTQAGRGFDWAPDGNGFVAVVALTPKAHYGFAPDLVTFDLDGEMKILGTFEGLLATPAWSPDGSTIGFMGCEDVTPSFFALRTIPASGGESRVMVPKHEASFGGIQWLPDGGQVVTTVEQGERRTIGVVDPEQKTVKPLFDGPETPGSATLFSLSADGSRVAFVHSDATSYGDMYVARSGGSARKLTDLNPWLREADLGEIREIAWTAPDGLKIQGLLILPFGYQEGTRYPTLLHIHGGPCGAWTIRPFAGWHDWGQFMAQRGYAVLMPNPRGSSGRGSEFLCGITKCYGEPDWQDLMAGVDYLIDEGIADPDQLVVGGWSGGGFLTNWTVTHSDRFKAAVSGAGIANWVSFQGTADVRSVFDGYLGRVDEDPETHWRLSPIRSIQNATTPTLILYGESDDRVPPSQGFEMYEGLKSRGVETQLVLYPREPHGLQERKHMLDLLERVTGWYDRHLGRS
ncbi:MAG: S9 family peptidase [Thermomicrobiales bacterium]